MREVEEAFLREIYRLDKEDKDAALDALFEEVDSLCWVDGFDQINTIVERFDTEKSSLTLLVGALSITLPCKNKLPARMIFFNKIYSRALKIKGEKGARELLKGLI